MEHLTCFVPGWLALGAQYQTDTKRQKLHMKLAEDLAYTCWQVNNLFTHLKQPINISKYHINTSRQHACCQMYEQQPTGIGPERVKRMKMDLSETDTREYILRPEAMEGWWCVCIIYIVLDSFRYS